MEYYLISPSGVVLLDALGSHTPGYHPTDGVCATTPESSRAEHPPGQSQPQHKFPLLAHFFLHFTSGREGRRVIHHQGCSSGPAPNTQEVLSTNHPSPNRHCAPVEPAEAQQHVTAMTTRTPPGNAKILHAKHDSTTRTQQLVWCGSCQLRSNQTSQNTKAQCKSCNQHQHTDKAHELEPRRWLQEHGCIIPGHQEAGGSAQCSQRCGVMWQPRATGACCEPHSPASQTATTQYFSHIQQTYYHWHIAHGMCTKQTPPGFRAGGQPKLNPAGKTAENTPAGMHPAWQQYGHQQSADNIPVSISSAQYFSISSSCCVTSTGYTFILANAHTLWPGPRNTAALRGYL